MLSEATKIVMWWIDKEKSKKTFGVVHAYNHNEAEIERVISYCEKRCDRVEVGVGDDVIHSAVGKDNVDAN